MHGDLSSLWRLEVKKETVDNRAVRNTETY